MAGSTGRVTVEEQRLKGKGKNAPSELCRTMQRMVFALRLNARCCSQLPKEQPVAFKKTECVMERRPFVLSWLVPFLPVHDARAVDVAPVEVRPDLAPDASLYDAFDPRLRAAARRLQDALETADVAEEERIWSEIIQTYASVDAPWVPEIVGRAWGNRGNARLGALPFGLRVMCVAGRVKERWRRHLRISTRPLRYVPGPLIPC